MGPILYICIGILTGTLVGYILSKEFDDAFIVGASSVISIIIWPIAIFFGICLLVGTMFISLFGKD